MKTALITAITSFFFTSSLMAHKYDHSEIHCPYLAPSKSHIDTVRKVFEVAGNVTSIAVPKAQKVFAVANKALTGGGKNDRLVRSCRVKLHGSKKDKVYMTPGDRMIVSWKKDMRKKNEKVHINYDGARKKINEDRFLNRIEVKVNVVGGADLHFSATTNKNRGGRMFKIHANGQGGLGPELAQRFVNMVVAYTKTGVKKYESYKDIIQAKALAFHQPL